MRGPTSKHKVLPELQAKRAALLIANSEYSDESFGQLLAPPNDAIALATVLKDPRIGRFEVLTLLNESRQKLEIQIEKFFAGRDREDMLLIYFSGHGIKDEDGRLFLATNDSSRTLLRSTAIPSGFVNDIMEGSRSRRQILILDCCYSGAFARGLSAKASPEINSKEYFEGKGRIVLTASDHMQYAFEGQKVKGDATKSLFTRAMVEGLQTGAADVGNDGYVSADDLFHYLRKRLSEDNPLQQPRMWAFDLSGALILAKSARRADSRQRGPSRNQASSLKGVGIFLNVPFDEAFKDLYLAYIAGVSAYGLVPRCTLETGVGSRRLEAIRQLIKSCQYSLHDLSRVQIDRTPPRVPRLNIPFELGIAVDLAYAGRRQHEWRLFESVPYRWNKSISDLDGSDPYIHGGKPQGVLRELSNSLVRRGYQPTLKQMEYVYRELKKASIRIAAKSGSTTVFTGPAFKGLAKFASSICDRAGIGRP